MGRARKALPEVVVQSWLREARRRAGITQQDLADRCGVSRRSIQFIEYGTYEPGVNVALRLARVLECQVEDLFRLTD
jgi:DNA-binding XRE family transcriptional regulator